MLFFVLTSYLLYNGRIAFHLHAGNTTKKSLSFIEWTNSDSNFDAHKFKVRIYSIY